jgi:hypothetical protein
MVGRTSAARDTPHQYARAVQRPSAGSLSDDPAPGVPDDHGLEHQAHDDQDVVVGAGVGQAKRLNTMSAPAATMFSHRIAE